MNSYVLKISFKRWAKLWSSVSLKLYPLSVADQAERRDFRIAQLIGKTPGSLRRELHPQTLFLKKRQFNRGGAYYKPDQLFHDQCYNPGRWRYRHVTIRRDADPISVSGTAEHGAWLQPPTNSCSGHRKLIDLSNPFILRSRRTR